MKLAPSRYFETFGSFRLLHPEADVRIQLPEQTVTQMAGGDIFSFLSRKGAVIYQKMHGDGGLGDFLEGDGPRVIRGAQSISDTDIRNAGDGYDGADTGFRYIHLIQTVKFVELTDLYLFALIGIVVVDHHHLLIDPDRAVVHLADADAPHILIIVDGADQYLGSGLRIPFGSGNGVDNCLKERRHVLRFILRIPERVAVSCRGKDKGTVKLRVRCVQIHQKLQNLVNHLRGPCVRPVNFIDTDDHRKLQLQGLAEHKLGLGHRTLKGVYYQNDAVDHLENTLHLTAEIRMARRINDIDFDVLIGNCRIFGEDGNAALPFNVAGVHYALGHRLIGAEYAALL